MPHYPDEDDKLRASKIVRRRGGNTPNTLEVLQQLLDQKTLEPISLVLASMLPSRSSPSVEEIKASLPNVDLSRCFYREESFEPASSYIIKSLATSSRTIVNYNELREMTFDEFRSLADDLGDEAMWYHFEVSKRRSFCRRET